MGNSITKVGSEEYNECEQSGKRRKVSYVSDDRLTSLNREVRKENYGVYFINSRIKYERKLKQVSDSINKR